MRRASRLVGALLLGWVLVWLGLGLAHGDPTLLLRPGASDEVTRLAYLVLLYLWLVGATWGCWRRWGPRWPTLSRPRLFGAGVLLGLAATALHRLVLWMGGWWTPPTVPPSVLAIALVTSPLLAAVEEAVFRGYLWGTVREDLGRGAAYLGVNGFFSLVHLFRHGSWGYKLALGLGLLLAGLVLSRLAEVTGSLWPGIGLHTVWVVTAVVDPPGGVVPGLLPGLAGDPAAGLVGWLLLLSLLGLAGRLWSPRVP